MAKTKAVAKTAPVQPPALRPIDQFKQTLSLAAPTIMKMLPRHIEPQKFQAMVVTAVANNEKLLDCSQKSLLRATAEAAQLGLSLNPAMKEGDILPVWNNQTKQNEAQFRPRFMGLMKLARQSGEIKDIWAHGVRENDKFEYDLGLNKSLTHVPTAKDRGELTHVYVVWALKDGTKAYEILDRDRVEKIRARSESWKYYCKQQDEGKSAKTPWIDDEEEMWRKTAVKAGSKYMPMSAEALNAINLDDAREFEERPVTVSEEGEIIPDVDAIDITEETPTNPPANAQISRLEQKIATPRPSNTPAPESNTVQPPSNTPAPTTSKTDYTALAQSWLLKIDNLDAIGCTNWRKVNAAALSDMQFNAPAEYKKVMQALDG